MPSRRGACSTGWSATASARCSGRRSSADSPPGACRPRRSGSWSSASARSRRSSRSSTGRSMPTWRSRRGSRADADDFKAGLHRVARQEGRPQDRRADAAQSSHDLDGAQYRVGDGHASGSRSGGPPPRSRPARSSRRRRASSDYRVRRTMQIAQELYEGIDLGAEGTQGLITYMRTDSTNVAAVAQQAARDGDQRQVRTGVRAGQAARLRARRRRARRRRTRRFARPRRSRDPAASSRFSRRSSSGSTS